MRKTFVWALMAVLFIMSGALTVFADTGPPVNRPDNPAEVLYLDSVTDLGFGTSSLAPRDFNILAPRVTDDAVINMSLLVSKSDVAVGQMRNGGSADKPYIIRLSAPPVRTLAYHRNNSASRPLRV